MAIAILGFGRKFRRIFPGLRTVSFVTKSHPDSSQIHGAIAVPKKRPISTLPNPPLPGTPKFVKLNFTWD
jgi:hypothetical protein